MTDKINPIRETDAAAIALARQLVREAKFGALGVFDPVDGSPYVSRVAVAADGAGVPAIFVSSLSKHTQALMKDPRCSLLVGEPGKGDPLAHPRITLACDAERLGRDDTNVPDLTKRFLKGQPKAQLYIGLADFSFFRLHVRSAALNGGFGKAYRLSGEEVCGPAARMGDEQ
jgi:heme iron utilization protein